MIKVSEVLFKITWTRENGTGGGSAVASGESARQIRDALYAAGWKAVWLTPASDRKDSRS